MFLVSKFRNYDGETEAWLDVCDLRTPSAWSAGECRMLCRQNPDGSLVYDPSFRDDSAHQPEVLVPESLENPSVDSQASDGFVPGSPPLEDFGESPAPPPPRSRSPSPSPSPPPTPLRIRRREEELPPNSPLTPLSHDESSSDEEPPPARNYLQLTDTVTGSRKRIYYDRINGNRL